MSSKIKKYDAWNTLVIWSPLGLLDFKVEFEEGVANLFGTSYLWPHCEELDELHGFHSYGICNVMEYIHIDLYVSFIHMHLLRWCKLRLCLILWLQMSNEGKKISKQPCQSPVISIIFEKIQVNAVSLICRDTHTPYFHFWPPTTPAETGWKGSRLQIRTRLTFRNDNQNIIHRHFLPLEFKMETRDIKKPMSFSSKKICNHSPPRNVTCLTLKLPGTPNGGRFHLGCQGSSHYISISPAHGHLGVAHPGAKKTQSFVRHSGGPEW